MLEAVFGFHGRINRLQYFLRSLTLGVVTSMVMIVLLAVTVVGRRPTDVAQIAPMLGTLALFALPVMIANIWIGFSLQARRFRDMGWEPLIVIPSWIAFDVVFEFIGFAGVLSRHPSALSSLMLLLCGLGNIGLGGCLLFWPGSADDGSTPAAPRKAAKLAQPMQPAPAMRTAPVWGVDIPRTSFGRRGL